MIRFLPSTARVKWQGSTCRYGRRSKNYTPFLQALEDRYVPSTVLGYWRFDDLAGVTAADASGNGHSGQLTAGASFITDVPGSTVPQTGAQDKGFLSLDGVSGAVVIPNSPVLQPTTAITLEAWVKFTSSYTTAAVVGRQYASGTSASFEIGFQPDLFLSVTDAQGNPTTLETSITPALNQWHHIAGTWDGSVLRLYFDGVQAGYTAFTGPIGYQSNNPVLIGADSNGPGGNPSCCYFPGEIDEVRISSVALNPADFLMRPPDVSGLSLATTQNTTAGTTLNLTVTRRTGTATRRPATAERCISPAPTRTPYTGELRLHGRRQWGSYLQGNSAHRGGPVGHGNGHGIRPADMRRHHRLGPKVQCVHRSILEHIRVQQPAE
jgi:hypothetical protein